jgi:hypothetical protein
MEIKEHDHGEEYFLFLLDDVRNMDACKELNMLWI